MWLPNDDSAAAVLVTLYVEHGVDASVRDKQGLTAADHASRRGLFNVAELLRAYANEPEEKPMHEPGGHTG